MIQEREDLLERLPTMSNKELAEKISEIHNMWWEETYNREAFTRMFKKIMKVGNKP